MRLSRNRVGGRRRREDRPRRSFSMPARPAMRARDNDLRDRIRLAAAAILFLGGLAGLGVAAVGFRTVPPEPVRITAGAPVTVPERAFLGSAPAIFAEVPDERHPPAPKEFGCRLDDTPAGNALDARPNRAELGERVRENHPLVPVIQLGDAGGKSLTCSGPALGGGRPAWVYYEEHTSQENAIVAAVLGGFAVGAALIVNPFGLLRMRERRISSRRSASRA